MEVSYAADTENARILMRVRDRSEPSGRNEKIFARPMYDDEYFQPWNEEPRDGEWQKVA